MTDTKTLRQGRAIIVCVCASEETTPLNQNPNPGPKTTKNQKQVQGIPATFLPPSLLLLLQAAEDHPPPPPPSFRLLLAGGVVPPQQALWLRRCPHAHTVTTDAVLPTQGGAYPGLGVDRALSLRGAGEGDGWPCLVVDAGTALTFTVGDARGGCGGGAILPGLRLAVQALATRTALLPEVSVPKVGEPLPSKFARGTGPAIRAGVLHGVRVWVGWGVGWFSRLMISRSFRFRFRN